jgi:hypothetical protein
MMASKKPEELRFDPEGKFSVEAMQMWREPSDVPYDPPPNSDAKWKAMVAVGVMPKWSGTMKGVMVCLIQCANSHSGKCCPSEKWIAQKLGCTDRAVRKAISRIKEDHPELLVVYHRSQPGRSEWKANGYILGWEALIAEHAAAFPRMHGGTKTPPRRNRRSQHRGTNVPMK